jgi:UDP-N-acetylglucosamine 1-carboxyvinyltransferase
VSQAYVINGPTPLQGSVTVSGATKNVGLKLLAAALLAPGTSTVTGMADIADMRWFGEVLERIGVTVDWQPGVVRVTVPEQVGYEAPYELVSKMRASTAVLGPLLARMGRARVALPGGDFLGPRPIDLHMRGLEQMGADIKVVHGFVEASCERLKGTRVTAMSNELPSVGATETLMLAAVLADGRTIIENAAREPEIVDIAVFLEKMGAKIDGAGTHTIEVEGVDSLHPAEHDVMPDRLEAGTYLFATATTGGDVTVKNMRPGDLDIVLETLVQTGRELDIGDDSVRIVAEGRPKAVDISTLPYPGFATDLLPMATTMLALADGNSIVTENIYDSRYFHVDELARMGANVRVERHYCIVRGVEEFTGAEVRASDVSAGAALVIAGLAARGRTQVSDIIHIDRRYENLEGKLRSLGADIERVGAPVPA